MSLHLGVLQDTILHHVLLMRDETVAIVRVGNDAGAASVRAVAVAVNQTIGQQVTVIRAGIEEGTYRKWSCALNYCNFPDLGPVLDLTLQWKKNMELGKRRFYME